MQSCTDKVLSELNQVHELARKLSEHLEPSQIEICRILAREIACSIEKAICTAKTNCAVEAELVISNGGGLDVGEILNQKFSDKEQKISKKRKILANRTNQVRVSTEAGAEMPPDDGQSWRKYGQKDILGAKHPRSYYRCTYRKTRGCSAMKQVQKSDENSSIFDITYLGTHTCFNSPQQIASKTCLHNPQESLLDQHKSFTLHLDFQTNLKVKTESSDLENQDPTSSFSFPSTPIDGMNPENALFCSSPRIECGYEGILPSALMSPTTSGSNFFPWPPCEMNSQADSELADQMISAAISASGSPVMYVEFMPEYGEMDTEIPFDTSIFFD